MRPINKKRNTTPDSSASTINSLQIRGGNMSLIWQMDYLSVNEIRTGDNHPLASLL